MLTTVKRCVENIQFNQVIAIENGIELQKSAYLTTKQERRISRRGPIFGLRDLRQ